MTARRFACLASLFLIFGAPSAAPAQRGLPADVSVLAQSGIVFPAKLGNFTRVEVRSVEAGRVGAWYALRDGPAQPSVDIFVKRVSEPLEDEFAENERIIAMQFQDLQPIRDLAPPEAAPDAIGRLWRANIAGRPVHTAMVLRHVNGWRIKLRATLAAEQAEADWPEIEKLIQAFDWTASRA